MQTDRTNQQTQNGADGNNGVGHLDEGVLQRQTAIFSWKDVVYDIRIKGEARRILDYVDGWVKPGTLTALMVSNREMRMMNLLT
jgi:hypothetical protein